MIRKTDTGIVPQNLDRFVKTTCKVECSPLRQIVTDRVEVDDTIFDERAIDGDVRVKVDASTESILYLRHNIATHGPEKRVMVSVLLKVQGVPVLRIRNPKDEVDDFALAALDILHSFRRLWVDRR